MDLELSAEESELRDNVRSVLASVCPPPRSGRSSRARATPRRSGIAWSSCTGRPWRSPRSTAGSAWGSSRSRSSPRSWAAPWCRVPSSPPSRSSPRPCASSAATRPLAADLLGRIAAGELTGTVALAESGRWEPAAVAATAEETADGWVLRGTKDAVLDGAGADEVLVVARAAGTSGTDGLGAFVVPRCRPRGHLPHGRRPDACRSPTSRSTGSWCRPTGCWPGPGTAGWPRRSTGRGRRRSSPSPPPRWAPAGRSSS